MDSQIFENARKLLNRIAWRLAQCSGEGVSETLARLGEQDISKQSFRLPEPQKQAVSRYLPDVIAETRLFDTAISEGIAATSQHLRWMQTKSYTDALLGEGFSANYAWCDLIGPAGFFPGDDFIVGLLMLGPNRHYKDHYHPAPELYWPMTAPSLWRKADSDFIPRAAGEIIWHPSMTTHATKTSDKPLLAIWAWTRDVKTPAKLV